MGFIIIISAFLFMLFALFSLDAIVMKASSPKKIILFILTALSFLSLVWFILSCF